MIGFRTCLGLALCVLLGCGEEEPRETVRRSAPPMKGKSRKKDKGGGADDDAQVVAPPPKRARRELTREDFELSTRDPFQGFVIGDSPAEEVQVAEASIAARRAVMSEYDFEDLKLVGIVMSKGAIQSRALFVASDHKSYTVKQGEYFSRAEVLLAAINHDYIEIEVVDEDLAGGLNLAQGERRAIYLKTE